MGSTKDTLKTKLGFTQKTENLNSDFVTVFLNFAYLFCISPFRIQETPILEENLSFGRSLKITSCLPQKVVCASCNFLCFFWFIRRLILRFPQNFEDPLQYFVFAYCVTGTINALILVKKLWLNQNDFLSVSKYFQKLNDSVVKNNSKYLVLLYLFCTIYIGVVTNVACSYAFLTRITKQGPYSQHNATSWLDDTILSTKQTLFLDTLLNGNNSVSQLTPIWEHWVFTPIGLIGIFSVCLLGRCSELLVFLSAFTLWSMCNKFHEDLNKNIVQDDDIMPENIWECRLHWKKVSLNYKILKKISFLINKNFGAHVTWFLIQTILYDSAMLKSSISEFKTAPMPLLISEYIFCGGSIATIWLAADSCYKVIRHLVVCCN